MGSLGAPELLIIGVVLVLLFGATRLPQTAKGLAQSLRIFRHELRDDDSPDQARSGTLPQGQSGQVQPGQVPQSYQQQGYQQPGYQQPGYQQGQGPAGHQPDASSHPVPHAPGAEPSEPHGPN